MIWPSRTLDEMIKAVDSGQPIDHARLYQLQALDLLKAGDEFAKDAILADEAENRAIEQFFNTGEWPTVRRYREPEEPPVG